jgi:hypothetical protein
MSDLKNHTTQELINELSKREHITFIPTPINKNKVEVYVEDCLHKFPKHMPNRHPYVTNCTYDEFHYNCKGVLVIEHDA